jgi:uncharacterized protein YjiS (DUF1127 family)
MFSQIKKLIVDSFIKLERTRLHSQLIRLNDKTLEETGFSRDLLEQGVSAWPWRLDGELKIARVYSLINQHEKEVQHAIKELNDFSDRGLADLGLTRGNIEFAVRYGRDDSSLDSTDYDLNSHPPLAA